MNTKRSSRLFQRAQKILPGGVDSPVRAFKSVGASPLFIRRAAGAHIEDVDGNRYVDYVMSWGPLIHGHAPRGLVKSLAAAARLGTSFGAPSPLEVELGERVRTLMPSLERVRFVSSGTEAAMSALRVARAATKRDRILKFEGCYHGHADAFLVKAGSGALTLGTPTSPGVTRATSADTLVAAYNDLGSVQRAFDAHRRSDRRHHRRADRGQHGSRPACRGIPGRAARDQRKGRRAADFRRGDLGFSRRARRRAGAGRRATRTDVSGQNHRRRSSGGRVRRTRGPDGTRVAGRACVSGGNVIGQSAGDDRGALVSEGSVAEAVLVAGEARCASGDRACRVGTRRRRRLAGQRDRLGADAVLHESSRARLRIGDEREHRALRAVLSRHASPRHLSAAVPIRSWFLSAAHTAKDVDATIARLGSDAGR